MNYSGHNKIKATCFSAALPKLSTVPGQPSKFNTEVFDCKSHAQASEDRRFCLIVIQRF